MFKSGSPITVSDFRFRRPPVSISTKKIYRAHPSSGRPADPGIQGNENVDKLAKAALNRASCSGKLICWSDLKPKTDALSTQSGKKVGRLRGQTNSTKYSPPWAKTSTGEAKEQVENGRRQCVDFGWATRGSPRATFKNIRSSLFCYACDSLYTVRHILIECPDSSHQQDIPQCN
ncbi:hypothetical protein PoB_002049200 [Plakobranchus ocellatus]|uniref:RNase H type-1 domain-containing protein n=1 Tax=Plakobranchus ocellatus TaxID=259542 RepID=A0AAV3ZHK8_9GAST|nr:hypothetical protein PoB_002049200 [Plakobranchus ocellatus]